MNELGIERLSVFDMPPVEFVALAADLGCQCVGMGLASGGRYNPHGYRAWSLRDDAALRRETRAALRDRGVRISILEGFAVIPDQEMQGYERDMDILAELGGDRISVVSMDQDLQRTIDGFAAIAELAAARNILVSAEIGSLGPIAKLEQAQAAVQGVGMGNFSLLIDTMHFFRLGNTLDQLAGLSPELIGYVQLCDALWAARFATYIEEALYERLVPGEGELPLQEALPLVPDGVVVSLELPRRSLAEQGIGPRERLTPAVAAARSMLAKAGKA